MNVPVRHGYKLEGHGYKLEGHGLRTAWLGSVAVCTLYVYSLFPTYFTLRNEQFRFYP